MKSVIYPVVGPWKGMGVLKIRNRCNHSKANTMQELKIFSNELQAAL